jgi:LPXTG-motif cell wall-anchored protein
MNNHSCLDGSMVENLVVPVADQNVTAQEFIEPMSNASGLTDAVFGTKEQRNARREARVGRREQRFQTRMDAKTNRNQAKLTQAEALKEGAKDDGTATALASLGTPAKASETTNNTSKYIMYGVGALVLIGGAYFLLRKKK